MSAKHSVTAGINLEEVLKYADQGDPDAMLAAVGYLAAEGYIGEDAAPEINERYLGYLNKLTALGNSACFIYLGNIYVTGEIVARDTDKAIDLYEQAVAHGEPYGNECIGQLYFEGEVVPRDYAKAFEYFTKDKKKKSFITDYYLGEMYRLGLHVSQDQSEVCRHYAIIARSKNKHPEVDDYYWRAAYRLGCALHRGMGIKKDLKEALRLIEIARDEGYTEHEIIEGEGITEDAMFVEWSDLCRELGKF